MQRQVLQLIVAASLAGALACKSADRTPPVPAPAPVVREPSGPAAPSRSGSEFEVELTPGQPAAIGASSSVIARVVAKEGFKVNDEYPLSFTPQAGAAGVELPSGRMELREGVQRTPCASAPKDACEVRAPIAFRATTPGSHQIAGVLAFSVCNAEKCLIEKARLAVQVEAR